MKREMPTSLDFEIINITPLDKYISECEIKVFYYGKNRNRSYISKAVGNQIANSLPRTPIVAFYNEEVGDFEDHGEEIIINKQGIKFIKKTVPYGAVAEHTPIMWKKFLDDRGVEREYLVVKGFLWTGRYPFLQKVIDNPKGQSMEFFEESIVGNWAKFDNEDEEFFIFNEADISALCILGDDIEPCFEDSTIGKPEILFSLKKNEFKQEFNKFMMDLNKVLDHNSAEGGITVKDERILDDIADEETDFANLENKDEAPEVFEEEAITDEEIVETDEEIVETVEDVVETVEDVVETELETEVEVVETEMEAIETEMEVEAPVEVDNSFAELQSKYSLMEEEFNTLKADFAILVEERKTRELAEKENICNKFSILGEDILSEFRVNLDSFTSETLEKELSVVAFNKGITFNLLSQNEGIVTPIPQKSSKILPAWLQAIENKENAQ